MRKTFTLIHADGTKEEKPFLINNGKEYISEHISRAEFGQHDTGEVIVFEPIIELFESARETVGRPIRVNSGYRADDYQKKLYQQDIVENGGKPSGKVASPGNSPHATGAAMDLAVPENMDAASFAALLRKRSVDLKFPMARTGWKMYNGTFVHCDMVHMLFEPYIKGQKNPHPEAWSKGVTW